MLIIAILFAALIPGVSHAKSAKDFYRDGERLLKSKDPYGAVRALSEAVKLDAKNKKYRRTLEEASRLASDGCVGEAVRQISGTPGVALRWLTSALEYNPQNKRAAELLSGLEAEIGQAKWRIETERQSLHLDQLEAATQTLRSMRKYSGVVPEYALLEADLSAAKRLADSRTALSSGELLLASRILTSGSLGSLANEALRAHERSLRAAILSAAGSRYNASRPRTLNSVRAAAVFQSVAERLGPHEDLVKARADLLKFLNDLGDRGTLPARTPNGEGDRAQPRVLLQALELIRRDTVADPQIYMPIQVAAEKLRNQPGQYVRIRFRGPSQPRCAFLDINSVREFTKGLDWVVLTEGEDYHVAINLDDVSCQETENPQVSVRAINSTYVAGQSQAVNPEYVQLKARLEAAQIELARAELAANNSFLIGMYRGTVMNLQGRLSRTNPFVYQDLEQAYQLHEFVAKRQVFIKATGSYIVKTDTIHGGKDFAAEANRSSEDGGITGALAQDRRYSNREPQLKSLAELRSEAVREFEQTFRRQVKQAVSDMIALSVFDDSAPEMARLEAMLRLADCSEETTYSKDRAALVALVESRLLAEYVDGSGPALTPPTGMQPPDIQPKAPDDRPRDASAEGAAGMIDRILDGVVAIETDTGSTASGFFASKDCQVLTNWHVVAGAKVVIVKDRRRRLFVGEVSHTNVDRDLALIRTNSADCRPLGLDRAPTVRVADEVFAVGSPLGLSGTVTKGIVSGVRRGDDGIEMFQIDAALNPGNSGGPLINERGRVVGVNTFKLKGFENLNFSVSIAEAFAVFGSALSD